MSESKEIKIRAVLDSSTFDKGVNEIQEKLRKLAQQQTQGAGAQKALGKDAVLGKYAQQVFGDFSKESQRQLEQMYQVQRREAVNQQITLKGKEAEMAKMAKIDGDMTKQQKERLELLKKEIDLLKEKHRQTLSTAAETQKALDKIKPDAIGGGTGGGGGGLPGTGGIAAGGGGAGGLSGMAQKAFGGLLQGMTAAAIVKGGFNAATEAYSNFYVTRNREMAVARGQVMTGASRDMREQFGGRGSDRAFWARERSQAFNMANLERDRQQNLDVVKGGTGAAVGGLAGMAAGAWGGASAGATIGMWGGLPGVALGGIGGALIGGVAGLAGGSYLGSRIAGGASGQSAIFDREKYRAQSMADMLKNRETIEASLKAQDPTKAYARDYFVKNYEDMSQFERSTGRRDRKAMYGDNGLLQTQMRIGEQYGGGMLSMEDIKEQTNAIFGAGGSTRSAGMSGFAGSLNRQLGISTGGQLIGKLQGMTGMNQESTQDATRRLLAEAVRLGVDTSKMPQEMERMTAITAQLATSGGGFSTIAAETYGAGVAGLSANQIQAAGTAYQGFESRSTATEGLGGQIGAGFLLGDQGKEAFGESAIGKIRENPRLINMLQNMSAADLQKNPAVLSGMARDLGMNTEDLLKAKQKMDIEKQTFSQPEEDIAKELGDLTKGMTASEVGALGTGQSETAKKYQDLQYRLTSMRGGTLGSQYFRQGADVMTSENLMISGAGREAQGLAAAQGRLEGALTAPMESAAEKEKSSAARGQADMLSNLNKNLDSFGVAADQSVKNAASINFAMDAFEKALKENGGKMNKELESISKQLEAFSKEMESMGYPSAKSK